MAKVIMICGKICCGKSTYAQRLRTENSAAVLSVDEIMLAMFGQHVGDKHDEYAQRTKKYLFGKSAELIETGINVILDWGFWTKAERKYAREFYEARNIECELHYISVSEETWESRLAKRNALVEAGKTDAYYVDENLAKKFASVFEAPDEGEIDKTVKENDYDGTGKNA